MKIRLKGVNSLERLPCQTGTTPYPTEREMLNIEQGSMVTGVSREKSLQMDAHSNKAIRDFRSAETSSRDHCHHRNMYRLHDDSYRQVLKEARILRKTETSGGTSVNGPINTVR